MIISSLRKLNKKGFTLVELLATIILIALIMGLVLPSAMRVSKENEDRMCEEYANMMEEYAAVSEYKDNYYINLTQLDELSKVKDDCSRTTECPTCGGYVFVDHAVSPVKYKAYISCKSGCSTEGYNASIESSKTKVAVPTCKSGVVYNGQDQDLVTANPNKYILTNNLRKDVGSQNVRANLTDKRAYAWDDLSQDEKVIRNCSIAQKEFTVTANNILLRRYLPSPSLTYSTDGAVSGENPLTSAVTFTVKNSSGTVVSYNNELPVGKYTIIPSASVSSNYKIKLVNGTLTVENGTFLFTLDNQGASSAGTGSIYELYSVGWYSDINATNKITSITNPTKVGSSFQGYYDGKNGSGTLYINNSGSIVGPTTSLSPTTLYAKWQANELIFSGKTITKTFSTGAQTETFTGASNGTGSYTYSEVSEKNSSGTATSYITVSGTTITIAASTPVGTYTYVVRAKDNNNGATKDVTFTIVINKASFSCTTSKGNYTYAGTRGDPSVSANPGGGTVTYYYRTSSGTSGGTNYSGITSTSLAPSTYYMYATIGATTNYNGATCSAGSFTISKAASSITCKDIQYNGPHDSCDSPIVRYNNCTPSSFSSYSDCYPKDSYVIHCHSNNPNYYNDSSCTFKIKKADVVLSSDVSDAEIAYYSNREVEIRINSTINGISYNPSDLPIKCTPSDSSLVRCRVSGRYVYIYTVARKESSAYVTIGLSDTTRYNVTEKVVNINITMHPGSRFRYTTSFGSASTCSRECPNYCMRYVYNSYDSSSYRCSSSSTQLSGSGPYCWCRYGY